MGEYLPPPLGLLQLAAFLEQKDDGIEIEVLDCQAEKVGWQGLRSRIESSTPDIVAPSALSTCNTYAVARTVATAKAVNPDTVTVVGGQHFTITAQESLESYPEIDVVVRGEGEQTFCKLVQAVSEKAPFSSIGGISFRKGGEIHHNRSRSLIENLDDLPFPGYHFVGDVLDEYHFTMMAGRNTRYALIEGSRGCQHRCAFCTQWRHWQGRWRSKSAKRIADEMEFCYRSYGFRFFWLTDDDFGLGERAHDLCNEIISRGFSDEIMWFVQARCDDIVRHRDLLPKMRRAGLRWVLLGVESNRESTLRAFKKGQDPEDARTAVNLLKQNDIYAQAMFIIGARDDTAKSIASLRGFADELDPDLAIFMVLTPYPGTEIFELAKENGWIEDTNWANYDMIHAIMPTETLSREEVQEELYRCYRAFYGPWRRRLSGLFSRNLLKRRAYRHLVSKSVLRQLRGLLG